MMKTISIQTCCSQVKFCKLGSKHETAKQNENNQRSGLAILVMQNIKSKLYIEKPILLTKSVSYSLKTAELHRLAKLPF